MNGEGLTGANKVGKAPMGWRLDALHTQLDEGKAIRVAMVKNRRGSKGVGTLMRGLWGWRCVSATVVLVIEVTAQIDKGFKK